MVMIAVVSLHRLEDLLCIEPGVLIAFPGIYSEALGGEIEVANRLAEREVREATIRSKLHYPAGAKGLDEPERKRRVLEPSGVFQIIRNPERRSGQESGGHL